MATATSQAAGEEKNVDWNLCILCQKQTNQNVQCPSKSERTDVGAGYKIMAENLENFHLN